MTEDGAVKTPYAQVTKGGLRFKQRTKKIARFAFSFSFFPFLKKVAALCIVIVINSLVVNPFSKSAKEEGGWRWGLERHANTR